MDSDLDRIHPRVIWARRKP